MFHVSEIYKFCQLTLVLPNVFLLKRACAKALIKKKKKKPQKITLLKNRIIKVGYCKLRDAVKTKNRYNFLKFWIKVFAPKFGV